MAVVTACPFKVSFAVTFPPVDAIVSFDTDNEFETITVAVAVSQFAGLDPTSHNW